MSNDTRLLAPVVTAEKNLETPSYFDWLKTMRGDGTLRETANRDGAKDIRVTAMWLASYGRNGTGCRPSITTLVEDTGFKSDKTIRRHLALLVQLGWLKVEGKAARGVTIYSISTPDPGNPGYRTDPGSETCDPGTPEYRTDTPDPGKQTCQFGNPEYRSTPVTQSTDNQEYDQEYKDQEKDQEYECGSKATDTLGPDINSEAAGAANIMRSREPTLPTPVGVGWCVLCDKPYVENCSYESEWRGIRHQWVCGACGTDVHVDCYEDSRGKFVSYCQSCDPDYPELYNQAVADWRSWNKDQVG